MKAEFTAVWFMCVSMCVSDDHSAASCLCAVNRIKSVSLAVGLSSAQLSFPSLRSISLCSSLDTDELAIAIVTLNVVYMLGFAYVAITAKSALIHTCGWFVRQESAHKET